ncbi:MAG: glycosyltransferase family 4 protein [Saprospiraceae bacterium]
MRVLLSANIHWVLWHYRLGLIQALCDRGHEVLLLADPDDFGAPVAYPSGAQVFYLKNMRRGGLSILRNLLLLREYFVFLKKEKPDLAFFFTPKPNVVGGLAARMAGTPYACTFEGWGLLGAGNRGMRVLGRSMYRAALAKARRVFFLNADNLSEFVNGRLCRAAQALLAPGAGIDLRRFTHTPMPPLPPFVFLFAGRLLQSKGVAAFAEAARRLRGKARFQILGPFDVGHPDALHPDLLSKWVEEGIVEYLGFAADVRPHLRQAHVIVLPSAYPEGSPTILGEALATGRAIITTDMPGCRDAVDPGLNGWLLPTPTPHALTQAMLLALRCDRVALEALSRHSRAKADYYAEDRVIGLYMAVLSGQSAAAVVSNKMNDAGAGAR